MIDAGALARLHAASFTTPPPWSKAAFQSLLAQDAVVMRSMPEGGAPDGFILGRVVLDEAELLTIATDPLKRRTGIAAALLQQFEGAVRRRGVQIIFLEVSEQNTAALALYERAGFRMMARRKGYYTASGETAHDALILHKTL